MILIIIWWGIVIILAFATWRLPFSGKILAMIINGFIPDGLPFIDEFIQILGFFRKGQSAYKASKRVSRLFGRS